MSMRSMFFDSVSGDRPYDGAAYAALLSALVLQDGVVYGYQDALGVEVVPGMTVRVKTGAAFIQGRMFEIYAAAENLVLAQGDATYDRIDRIVVRLDLASASRTITLAVKAGTPAAVPAAPALQRDGTVHELSLVQIRVAAGASSLSAGNITDERTESTVCGYTNNTLMVSSALAGFKTGMEIYNAGTDDIRVRPGAVHVNGILVIKAAESLLTGESGLSGWQFVTIDNQGTIQVRAATGNANERPTDACYQWAGYNHEKHGFYYNTAERIIGAIYRVSSSSWYIINNYMETEEAGQNSVGYWRRTPDGKQECSGRYLTSVTVNNAFGTLYRSALITVPWTLRFVGEPAYSLDTNVIPDFITMCATLPATDAAANLYVVRTSSDSTPRTAYIGFNAVGRWK